MRGQRWRWGFVACLGLLLAVPCFAEETGGKDAGKITSRVPVDPLLVWGGRFEDPGTLLSGISLSKRWVEGALSGWPEGDRLEDGAFQTEPTLTVEGSGATSGFDADIIFKDGVFIQWPEGTRQ